MCFCIWANLLNLYVDLHYDLVIEAATENPDLKKQIFRALVDVAHPDALFASNTSSISITALAAATASSVAPPSVVVVIVTVLLWMMMSVATDDDGAPDGIAGAATPTPTAAPLLDKPATCAAERSTRLPVTLIMR